GHAGGGGVSGVLTALRGDGVGEEVLGGLAVAEVVQDEGCCGMSGEGAVAAWAIAARGVLAELPIEVVCALMVPGAAVSGGEQVQGVQAAPVRGAVEVVGAVVAVPGPADGGIELTEPQVQCGQKGSGFGMHRMGWGGRGVDAGEAAVQELPGAKGIADGEVAGGGDTLCALGLPSAWTGHGYRAPGQSHIVSGGADGDAGQDAVSVHGGQVGARWCPCGGSDDPWRVSQNRSTDMIGDDDGVEWPGPAVVSAEVRRCRGGRLSQRNRLVAELAVQQPRDQIPRSGSVRRSVRLLRLWSGGLGDPFLHSAGIEVQLAGDGGDGAVCLDGAGVGDALDDSVHEVGRVSAREAHDLSYGVDG
ncbi:hypothetical protein, partial [Micromonospora sp. CPCC 205714]|uniref:hypothetical protein n=1 Tax=Micromonospora sp. CPCC 205714 TaxID=3122402 RepID=UPI002FF2F5C5